MERGDKIAVIVLVVVMAFGMIVAFGGDDGVTGEVVSEPVIEEGLPVVSDIVGDVVNEIEDIGDVVENNVELIEEVLDSIEVFDDVELEPVSDVYEVAYVVDGDTFEMNTGERVRLICIDTPEREEYYYDEASDYLESLVLGEEVELVRDVSDEDEYGRLLRYVYVGNVFVNEEMVRGGYARAYPYGSDTSLCPEIEEAEAEAKSEGLGIWVEREVVSSQSASGGYVCSSDFYNCGDFSSHAEAQMVYELCGSGDVHRLDRDKDGVACEGLG